MALMAQNPQDIMARMAQAASDQPPPMMSAPVDPHATLTAPIGPPAPEPATMAGAKEPKMSDLGPQKEHLNKALMTDYEKDINPYGSPENHPGFFGKLLHGLNVATGGTTRRGWEEQGLEHRLQDIAKEESAEGLQGAQTEEAKARTEALKNPAEKFTTLNTDQGEMRFDPKTGEVAPLSVEGKPLHGPEKQVNPVLHETDQGVMLVDPSTGHVTPLTLNGKPLMPKAPAKPERPDTPEQQYIDEYARLHPSSTIAQAERQYSLDTQRPPQIAPVMMMVPNPEGGATATAVRPGQTIAPGATTATQYGAQNVPTTQQRNVAAQAQLVNEQMPGLISEIKQNSALLGPVGGRWNEFMQGKVGMDNPAMAGLRSDLLMMSSAVALMHARGRLPENLREEFDRSINAPKQTPENLIATLQHIGNWTKANMNVMKGEHGGAPRPANVPEGYELRDGPKGRGWYAPTTAAK